MNPGDDFDWSDMTIPSLSSVIYYDDVGAIKSISGVDPEMASQFLEMAIDNELAQEFMSGKRFIVDHAIIRDRSSNLVVRHRDQVQDGDRSFYSPEIIDSEYVLLADRPLDDGISLLVRVGQEDQSIAVIISGVPRFAVGSDIETLTFFVNDEYSPEKFIAQLNVNLSDLLKKGRVVFPTKGDLSNVEVRTMRLFENYRLEIGPTSSDRLELPAAFNDVVAIPLIVDEPDYPCFLVRVSDEKISISLHKGGGLRYDRSVSFVPILICRDNDPMSAADFRMVPADDLVNTGVEFPNPVAANEVVIFTPLWYRKTALIREK